MAADDSRFPMPFFRMAHCVVSGNLAVHLAVVPRTLTEPEALVTYDISSAREALGVLFQLENTFGITPNEGGTLSIDPKADGVQKMVQATGAWHNANVELKSGETSEDDYKSWKSSFKL